MVVIAFRHFYESDSNSKELSNTKSVKEDIEEFGHKLFEDRIYFLIAANAWLHSCHVTWINNLMHR